MEESVPSPCAGSVVEVQETYLASALVRREEHAAICATLQGWKEMGSYVVFQLRVEICSGDESSVEYVASRRYSEFERFNRDLLSGGIFVGDFPPKQYLPFVWYVALTSPHLT